MKNKVIVKHIPQTQSPYGRQKRPVRVFNPTSGQMEEVGVNSGKRKPNGVYETLRFGQNRQTGKFVTGLDEQVSNPFHDMDVVELRGTYALDGTWTDEALNKIVGSKEISKQQWFEILDGVSMGTYTSTIAPSLRNSPLPMRISGDGSDATFIEKFEIILYEGSNVFTGTTSRGRMAIQLLLNSRLVAPNKQAINKDTHHFYIAEEQEEEKSRNEIDTLENRAILALVDVLEKQPQHRAYQLGVTLEVFAGYVSPAAVKDQLNRHIKAKLPNHRRDVKVERLKKFLEAYDMITSNYPLFLSKYMVNQALRNGVLYTDSGKVFWRSKVNSPEHHAWRSTQSLVLALSESMGDFDPEKEINNSLFGDMYEDLKTKGVQVNV